MLETALARTNGAWHPLDARAGEVIAASTTEFTAEAMELHGAPPFGSLVKVVEPGRPTVYALVANVVTGGLDPSRRAVADLAGVHFDIPDTMRRLECMIAPTQEGGIYYTGPSDDFSRPGRMWWSVPAGEDEFTTWAETTTVYHEGVPGHHLQVATATYRKDTLNNWRRNACWVSGHGEGWALYAERLMLDLGYLSDPGDHMGMLDMQRMRAARVVFDIGVHLELDMPERWGEGPWTAEKGYDFLSKHLDISEGQRRFEFTRYLGWPGQAPSYKVGQRLWEQIRDARREAEGDAFDLRAFHTEALNMGSVGLDTLRRALLPAG